MLKDFKEPDVKAPRYRKKVFRVVNKDLYSKFISKYPEHQDCSYNDFMQHIDLFHGELWKTVLDHRDGVELPENIGNIFLGSCWSPKKDNIDYNKSKKVKKAVSFNNYDTDGKLGKIFYTNLLNRYRFTNRVLWKFEATRDFKRMSSAVYKQNYKKYIDVDPTLKIHMLYKKSKTRDWMQSVSAKQQDLYNEFDMD